MTTVVGLDGLPERTDVLIAGGGPSGLFLAADLAHHGVSSVVLEPRVELDWLRPRAKTTNARTMTHLRRLGLADALRAAAPLDAEYADSVAFCTSLVGAELTRFHNAFQVQTGRYEPQPESGQQVAQPLVEQVLREAVGREPLVALHLGAAFVRRANPAGEDGGDAGPTAVVADGAGREQAIGYRFLVGADGVASTVRRDLGMRLEGGSAAKSNLGLLFRSRALASTVTLDPALQYWVVGNDYAGMVGPLDRADLWWSIVQGYDPGADRFREVEPDEVVRHLAGVDVDVEVVARDPWTARMLLAPSYRSGPTFLVGDAAHANPPWGGHGFNTCIGDAANLAWKLAATVRGWGGEALLDSYEPERRPVAARTIRDAAANGELLADDLIHPALGRPGPEGEGARARAAEVLRAKESEFHSLGLVLGYQYAESPLVTTDGTAPPPEDPIHYRPSAAPGCLLPHAWLGDGRSLYDLLGPGFTVLVDGSAVGNGYAGSLRAAEAHLAAARSLGIPVEVHGVPAEDGRPWVDDWEAPLLLVRPDQHVAWRGADPEALGAALLRAAGHLSPVPAAGRDGREDERWPTNP